MRKRLVKALGVVAIVGLLLVLAEGAARWIGFGDPVLYYNDAAGGIRPLPNQQVRRFRGATVTLDELGFRTAHPYTPGALRVLDLGDSVTWGGSRLDDLELFTEVAADVLRQKGRSVYAMNAGVNGSALVNQAEIWDRHATSSSVLVWLFPWGDTERSYATVGALWPARFKPRFALVETIDQLLYHYWLDLLRVQALPPRAFEMPHLPPGYEELEPSVSAARVEKNLAAAHRVLAEAGRLGVPVVLGITPYFDGHELLPLDPRARAFLGEIATEVEVLDVSEWLERASEPPTALYLDGVHFSAAGHRVVGQALGRLLAELPLETRSDRD